MMVMRFISQSGAFRIPIEKSGPVCVSFPAGMQKTMTDVEQQDADLIAMDAAIVAAIRSLAPEFETAYLSDSLPRWFQHQLDRCTVTAEHVANRADTTFIEALSALLGDALGYGQAIADLDVPGIVPEA
jgi:hypothetical protein